MRCASLQPWTVTALSESLGNGLPGRILRSKLKGFTLGSLDRGILTVHVQDRLPTWHQPPWLKEVPGCQVPDAARTYTVLKEQVGLASLCYCPRPTTALQGGCKHSHRWKPASDGQAGPSGRTDDDLLVNDPVDLAWSGLACKVCSTMS